MLPLRPARLNNVDQQILVGSYGLTTGAGIVEALVRAKDRGVDVRMSRTRAWRSRKGRCAACHRVALLTPEFLLRLGLSTSGQGARP